MPENFQNNHKKSSKSGFHLAALSIVLLNLTLVCCVYFFLSYSNNVEISFILILVINLILIFGLFYIWNKEKKEKVQNIYNDLIKNRFIKFTKSYDHKYEYIERNLNNAERELEKLNTELDEANIDVDDVENSKGTFLANVSHELRTPLNAILGYSQILERDSEWFSESHRNGIKTIQQSGEHLLNIINEILDFSKLDAHKTELENIPFKLSKTVLQLKGMIEVRAHEKGLNYEQNINDSLPEFVSGDEQKLKQILLNLLGNAIKFTESGKVALSITKKSEDIYCFAVDDSGAGINWDDQKNIFEAFYQINTGSKSKQTGTGLGLSISKRLVELMGGELKVQSESGKGSRFFFEIKLLEPQEHIETNTSESVDGYLGDKREILILGKDTESRFLILDTLRRLGFSVNEVGDKEKAITQVKLKRPDLIIIDFMKPFEDLLDFVRQIKILEAKRLRGYDPNLQSVPKSIKIIATSVSIIKEEQDMMLKVGCDSFLCKPFSNAELCEEIQNLLKIKWTINYKSQISEPETSDNTHQSLDQGIYNQFLDLAKKGDIRKIKNLAITVSDQHPDYQAFCKKVLQLCSQFLCDEIVAMYLVFLMV